MTPALLHKRINHAVRNSPVEQFLEKSPWSASRQPPHLAPASVEQSHCQNPEDAFRAAVATKFRWLAVP